MKTTMFYKKLARALLVFCFIKNPGALDYTKTVLRAQEKLKIKKLRNHIFFYERRCMHYGKNDVFYGKSIKIKFNNTTLNSGHSWERKTTQDKDLIHAYGLNKKLKN